MGSDLFGSAYDYFFLFDMIAADWNLQTYDVGSYNNVLQNLVLIG